MTKPIKAPPTVPYTYTKVRTKISDQEIAQAAYNAGFRGQALAIAVATAIGESHGNTTALNDRGEFSVGLWQINVNGYLVSRLKRWDITSWQQLWDPEINARAAYSLSNGGKKFTPWSIYKHGAHLKYMDRAIAATNLINQPITAPGGTSTIIPQPPTQVTDPSVLPVGQTSVSSSSTLILLFAIVGVVIIVGVMMLMKQQSNG